MSSTDAIDANNTGSNSTAAASTNSGASYDPIHITIRQVPQTHPQVQSLIKALDREVEDLYPDAAEFPWDGKGNWLFPENNHMAEVEEREGAFFFVAVTVDAAVGGKRLGGDDGGRATTETEDMEDMEEREGERGKAKMIGCVGIRYMPYFPLHWAPISPAEQRRIVVGEGQSTPTAELKRMYVVPRFRGRCVSSPRCENGDGSRSVAATLLRHVEEFAATEMQVRRLVLETGARQGNAMRLYARAGWVRRAAFGDYVGAREEIGGLSRCWEKWVGSDC